MCFVKIFCFHTSYRIMYRSHVMLTKGLLQQKGVPFTHMTKKDVPLHTKGNINTYLHGCLSSLLPTRVPCLSPTYTGAFPLSIINCMKYKIDVFVLYSLPIPRRCFKNMDIHVLSHRNALQDTEVIAMHYKIRKSSQCITRYGSRRNVLQDTEVIAMHYKIRKSSQCIARYGSRRNVLQDTEVVAMYCKIRKSSQCITRYGSTTVLLNQSICTHKDVERI